MILLIKCDSLASSSTLWSLLSFNKGCSFEYCYNDCRFKHWALNVFNCGTSFFCSGDVALVFKFRLNTCMWMWIFVCVSGNVPWLQQPSLSPQDLDLAAASLDLRINTHKTQSKPVDRQNISFSFLKKLKDL